MRSEQMLRPPSSEQTAVVVPVSVSPGLSGSSDARIARDGMYAVTSSTTGVYLSSSSFELATTHGAAHVERRAREAIEAPSARRSEGLAEPSTSQASIDAPHL